MHKLLRFGSRILLLWLFEFHLSIVRTPNDEENRKQKKNVPEYKTREREKWKEWIGPIVYEINRKPQTQSQFQIQIRRTIRFLMELIIIIVWMHFDFI